MPKAPLFLTLSALLSVGGLTLAQTEPAPIPAVPPGNTTPVPEPQPAPNPDPFPQEVPAAPPPPVTPAPAVVNPPVLPPRGQAAPLRIVFSAPLPTAVNGKKTYPAWQRVMTFSADRSDALRQGGRLTQSLEADLQRFLSGVPGAPVDARFEEQGGQWVLVQRNGYTVNLDKTRANVLAALQNPNLPGAQVVYTTQMPKRTLDYFLSRGITGVLGIGETNYYGSSKARMTNIHVGASHFQDRLVDSKLLSFNQLVGPVNAAGGFVTGLVISGERTASGIGGGICQVSTTVFRALYAAGLPVVERRNHSYQVHYYDPQGLDATIFQPSQDLKFANDTGRSLWFQTDWDDAQARLTVRVFGRPSDLTVVVGKPRTLATRPSPPDRLIPDASLPAGKRVQVDWAAPGATIEVERMFMRGDSVVKKDVLRSVYRPWPNIFTVGQ